MSAAPSFPFLTAYDPPGTSEGTLDPMGLYQIADQLAVKLVPSVRERMQRLRFLTAMAVGAVVTEDIEDAQPQRDASPYLVWEWLVVEALIRPRDTDEELWGVPGMLVTRRALERQGYLDARSYLKTPRIFGFNGVYKRLAIHLGLVDVHLAPGPNAQRLVDAWAHGLPGGASGAKELIARWRGAVRRSLAERPARTRPGWNADSWAELAQAFAPGSAKGREKRCLHDLLHAADGRRLGALPVIWRLLEGKEFDDDDLREELGLGCSLVALSDIVFMAESAHLADPHVMVGLVAADGGPVTWPLLTSLQLAKEYALTGERIPAKRAAEIGLANHVVPDDEVFDRAMACAQKIAALPARAAQDTKRILNIHLERAVLSALDFAFAAEDRSFVSPELRTNIDRLRKKS